MNIQDHGHIFKRFDNELENLHQIVLQMGALASNQLRESVQTLRDKDSHRARRVIQQDSNINALDIEADREITRIIAKRQPMAKDLREIIAVGKIVAELERAGDEARKIAALTIRFIQSDSMPPESEVLNDIVKLAECAGEMLATSMRAFDHLDLQAAASVIEQGLVLDEQLQATIRNLSDAIVKDTNNATHFVDIVIGIRALERFGGHAKNIAGHIAFITDGVDVRHEGDKSILSKLKNSSLGA